MSDLNAPPAGWFPDADDASTERWWGGTAWTSTTRPQNTQAQPPPLPVPAAVTMPPAGWYPDPQNPAGEKWFDGSAWTQMTQQAPGRQYAGAPGRQYAGAPGQPAGALGQPGFRWVSYGRSGRSTTNNPIVGVIVGLIFMGVAVVMFFTMRTPANMSATVTGTVTNVTVSQGTTSSNGRRNSPSCSPVAGFVVGGKTYTVSSSMGASPCPWAVGQAVVVAYDPASPSSAMIQTKGMMRFMPWIFGGIGALAAFGCLFSSVSKAVKARQR